MNKHLLVAFGTFLIIFATVGGQAKAVWLLDRTGAIVSVDGMVLGDDEQQQEQERDQEQEQEQENEQEQEQENEQEDSQDLVEGRGNDVSTTEKRSLETEKKLRELEVKREAAKKKLELEIKSREKRQEALKQKVKSKIEYENGKLRIKQETEDENGEVTKETETELPEDEDLNVEQEDGKILEIKGDKEGKGLEIKKAEFRAKTNLPISIGANNELIITRPDGTEKVVTVLPDQAAEKMRERGLSVMEEVELEVDGEEPVYKFQAQQTKKLLGLFNWSVRKETKVSAETGEEVSSETLGSAWTKLLERLSL